MNAEKVFAALAIIKPGAQPGLLTPPGNGLAPNILDGPYGRNGMGR